MKYLFLFILLFFNIYFFVFTSILGISYLGSEESSLYTNLYTFVNIGAIGIFSLEMIKKKIYITKQLLSIVLFQLLLLIVFFLENPSNEYTRNMLLVIYALSMPVCYVGYLMGQRKALIEITKWIDLFILVVVTGIAISLPSIISSKYLLLEEEGQGGININYQAASYYVALSYSLSLMLLLFGDKLNRFAIFRKNIYRLFMMILLIVQIVMCLMTGGRGGFVLMVVASFVMFYIKGFKMMMKYVSYLLLFGIILFVLISFIEPHILGNTKEILLETTERTFSYITSDGIDMSQTSDRDIIYNKLFQAIMDSPIIGYGIFGYFDKASNGSLAHNFILEILVQGGFIFFLIISIIIFWLYHKYKLMLIHREENILLVPLLCYLFVMLMFSGSYLTTPVFWFVISYIYSYNLKNQKISMPIL